MNNTNDGISMWITLLVCAFLALCAFTLKCNGAGFAISEHFTIFTAPLHGKNRDNAFAQSIAQLAESSRAEVSRTWLQKPLTNGTGLTTINVAFGKINSSLTWAIDHPQRRFHVIYITITRDNQIEETIANIVRHEIVHAVLATAYPHPGRLPQWIEEGIAYQYGSMKHGVPPCHHASVLRMFEIARLHGTHVAIATALSMQDQNHMDNTSQ